MRTRAHAPWNAAHDLQGRDVSYPAGCVLAATIPRSASHYIRSTGSKYDDQGQSQARGARWDGIHAVLA